MRIIDQNAPTDVERFWSALGEMRVASAIKRRADDVVIEEKAAVIEELATPGAEEAGRAAFLRGVNRKMDEVIAAAPSLVRAALDKIPAGKVLQPDEKRAWVKAVLAAYVESIPAGWVTVRQEKRTIKVKTVGEFDHEGRILSMFEEDIEV